MADPIAVYGAVIGTTGAAGAAWSIWHGIVRDRPRVKVVIQFSRMNHPMIEPEPLVTMDIMNQGRRPLSLSNLPGVLFPDGIRLAFSPLPWQLGTQAVEEGQKATYWMYEAAFKEGVKERASVPTRVVISDDAGRVYKRRIDRHLLRWIRDVLEEDSNGGEQ